MSAAEVRKVGVVGLGTMGAGIAQVCVQAGIETVGREVSEELGERARERIAHYLGRGVEKGRLTAEERDAALARLTTTTDLADLADCDVVIEAIVEDPDAKRETFRALEEVVGERAILATNTSALSVTAIAQETKRPERVVGMHFFNPAPVLPLVEVVRADCVLATNTSSLPVTQVAAGVPRPERVVGMHFFNPPASMRLVEVAAAERSSEGALAAAAEVAERMGRVPIRAQDSPGFVANRLARPFSLESLRLLGDGVADAAAIDRVVRLGGGFRMGPFELLDLIGLDVNLEIARSFFQQGGEPERWRPSPIQEKLVAEGRLGRKSGRGYYDCGEGQGREPDPDLGIQAPTLDPEALAKIDPAAEQVLSRLFAQIANEAAFALEEEIASPEDMETAMRLGFNWPLGPLGFAELIAPDRAADLLERLAAEKGAAYAPAPRLRRIINSST